MNTYFKVTETLLAEIKHDLNRPHDFAVERVGFISCRVGRVESQDWIMLASKYHPVEEHHYIEGHDAGATIGSDAIRKMIQLAYDETVSIVHVHEHPHYGVPKFSKHVDEPEMNRLIPDFWHVRPNFPHGAIVLSVDSMCGFAWDPISKQRFPMNNFTVVGAPMKLIRGT